MTDCEICAIKGDKLLTLFEDEKNIAFLAERPAAAGHLIAAPKAHHAIMERIPDFEIGSLFILANKLSTALFESLGIQGTNIIIENGIAAHQKQPHVTLHILPRKMDDNLGLTWAPKTLDEEEMATVELKIKESTKNVGAFEDEEKPPEKLEKKEEEIKPDEENYLLKHIRRTA